MHRVSEACSVCDVPGLLNMQKHMNLSIHYIAICSVLPPPSPDPNTTFGDGRKILSIHPVPVAGAADGGALPCPAIQWARSGELWSLLPVPGPDGAAGVWCVAFGLLLPRSSSVSSVSLTAPHASPPRDVWL